MELPIGRPGERTGIYGRSPYGGNLLLAPYELAAGLRGAGFDRCSTASNHSNDLGAVAIDSTLAALDEAGLPHAGTACTPAESAVTTFEVSGVTVAHSSYTPLLEHQPDLGAMAVAVRRERGPGGRRRGQRTRARRGGRHRQRALSQEMDGSRPDIWRFIEEVGEPGLDGDITDYR